MADISRTQIAVYGALAIALLLLGTKAIRSAERNPGPGGEPAAAEVIPLASGGGGGSGEDVVVHVAGAVRSPGVYRLPLGARVTDAVERAGGPAGAATLDSINLAARLADGQQVVVPASGGSAPAATAADGPISLGTATAEQLDTIEGIGPVTAADIIAFRDRHGGLSSVEQLDEVSGIGPATMKALRAGLQP